MIKTKLTPCGNLLYYWIQSHSQANQKLILNLHNFQTWTAEFLEKPASMSEIRASLSQLKKMDSIAVEGTEVILKNQVNQARIKLSPLPQFLLTKSNDNDLLIWGLLMVLSFLVLWVGSIAFCSRLSPVKSDWVVPTNPYQVLVEKD